MKVTKAQPAPIATTRDDFERLFDRLFPGSMFAVPRGREAIWSPDLDFSENEQEFIVRLEAPGIPKDDLEVNVEGQTLTLSGRRDFAKEEKTEEYFWREREQGRFVRSLRFPGPVDSAKVAATYTDGVLVVRIPKAEPTARNHIAIK